MGLILIIVAAVAVYRIAELDGEAPLLWGGLTFAFGILFSFAMPSFLASFLAVIAGYAAMFVNNLRRR